MAAVVEFTTDDGGVVAVEAVEEQRPGSRLVARGDGTVQAARTFEGALEGVRSAAESALRVFRDGALRPDGVEIEFGVKLAAETGAIIAKGTAEGHLIVRLTWSPSTDRAQDTVPAPQGDSASPSPRPGPAGAS
ncbi:CU044_2847 family protein [Streptomyces sp. ID05-39B]|uniref:CU044_2847 family protein n=1 Tax=Streptomyces sp. ID05-39B TaxID=3028664 RepID=UPI0029A0C008|nr:CU044_2847 family protein [Streptomyces sp. ID05-39B]MDX3532367.1 CU044_2847 family protein [Streptomyces sp. ID05-39B]